MPVRKPNLTVIIPKPAIPTPLIEQKYELLDDIGQGSVGKVRKAILRGTNEPFAVKTLYSDEPEVVNICRKECDLLQRVRHPNIVQFVELMVDDVAHRIDLVMSFISGPNLGALVKKNGPLLEDAARPLFAQLTRAIHHCHSRRVSHRDIKPENIMVPEDEHGIKSLVLLDFNAASLGGGVTPTGTKPYMSPELWQLLAYNSMTDVWSMGVCLYFMLAGYLPWIGERDCTLAVEVSRFPLRLPVGLSAEATNIIVGLLCRDVSSRLMVTGVLAHPWLGLPAMELKNLIGVASLDVPSEGRPKTFIGIVSHDSLGDLPPEDLQRSPRRTQSLDLFPASTSSPKTPTWPIGFDDEHVRKCGIAATSKIVDQQWYSPLPRNRKHRDGRRLHSHDWENTLRRDHLADLYDVPVTEPRYSHGPWQGLEALG